MDKTKKTLNNIPPEPILAINDFEKDAESNLESAKNEASKIIQEAKEKAGEIIRKEKESCLNLEKEYSLKIEEELNLEKERLIQDTKEKLECLQNISQERIKKAGQYIGKRIIGL